MQPATFDKLRKIVHEKSGIHIKDGKMSMVTARIRKRLRQLDLENEQSYLKHLEENAQEIVELLNVISTNVTHFYREPTHFDFLRRVMAQWSKEGQTRFRLWCAAAATGEEPYTIAITLTETFSRATPRPDMKLLATDISTRALSHCTAGVYRADQLENVPRDLRKRYFQPHKGQDDDMYQVRSDLKDMIVFRRLNLNEPPFPMKGPLDIVFCRNVMIYFDKTTKSRLLKDIYRLLKPGGYLIVSHTESLTGITKQYKQVGSSIYRKPG